MIQTTALPEIRKLQSGSNRQYNIRPAPLSYRRMQLVGWPFGQRPDFRPSHRAAMEEWHRHRWWGRWNVEAMLREMESCLIHSDTKSASNIRKSERSPATLLFAPSDGSLIFVDCCGESASISVWSKTADEARQCFDSLATRFKRRRQRRLQESTFFVLVAGEKGLETRSITFRARKHDSVDLSLHYGSGFAEWDQQLQGALKNKERGLTILRGEPGTGKTSYLRHLMWRLRSSHSFYYLPISAYRLIAAPATVDFWIEQEASWPKRRRIVLIEDAESLLMQRAADNRESISNLLNISDGFMAEYLNLHVICTINCPLKNLDPALTRPGRLVASREFRRLSRREANALAIAKNLKLEERDSYSLAEIYNSTIAAPDGGPKRIGFHPITAAEAALRL